MVINGFFIDRSVVQLVEKLDQAGAKAGAIADAINTFYPHWRQIESANDFREFVGAILEHQDQE